jgi:hypothetical protein
MSSGILTQTFLSAGIALAEGDLTETVQQPSNQFVSAGGFAVTSIAR